jgi:hypothetical protein
MYSEMKVFIIGLKTQAVSDHCTKPETFNMYRHFFCGEMKTVSEK